MKVLLAEYTTAHDPALAREGRAMLDVLTRSFTRCGHEPVPVGSGDFASEIELLAPACDMGLVIAPDEMLAKYTMLLEQHTYNLGCGFMTAALCANKVQTGKVLRSHGIPVPGDAGKGKRVIKPVKGCGSQGVRLSDGEPGEGEFAQEYIEGEHLSVSIVSNRVIGDACLYFTGNPAAVLAVNRAAHRDGRGRVIPVPWRGDAGPPGPRRRDYRRGQKGGGGARLPGVLRD